MSDAEDYLEDEDDIDEAYFYVEESFQVVVRTRLYIVHHTSP